MKTHFLLLVLAFVVSCKPQNNGLIVIDPDNYSHKEITLSDFADDITYIPLDNKYPMSIFYAFEKYNETYYISEKENGVFALDKAGKMLRIYGARGRGPGEYVYGLSSTINRRNGSVYIKDGKQILKYSNNGVYLGNILLEEYFDKIKCCDPFIIAFDFISGGEAKYNWIVIDTSGRVITQKFNYVPKFKSYHCGEGGVFETEGNVCYWDTFNDTVFSIRPDLSYQKTFLFQPAEYRYPRHVFEISQLFDFLEAHYILESKRYLIYNYWYKESSLLLIDKKSRISYKTTWKGDYGGIKNDLDGGAAFMPEYYYEEDGIEYMVGFTQPASILSQVNSNEFKRSGSKFPEKKDALIKLAKELKETDNPLLTIVRLKK